MMANPCKANPDVTWSQALAEENLLVLALEAGIRQASVDATKDGRTLKGKSGEQPIDLVGIVKGEEISSPLDADKPKMRRRPADLGAGDGPMISQLVSTQLWSGTSTDVRSALRTLFQLCLQSHVGSAKRARTNASILYQTGGHLAIVQCMRKFQASKKVQEHACGALQNLSYWETAVILPIGAIGGIDVVLDSMRQNSDDENIQKGGCRLLKNLVKEQNNADLVTRLDGIPVIVRAMTSFPQNQFLQRGGAGVIRRVGEHEHLRPILATTGAIHALADAFANFPDCSSVQAESREALALLMELDDLEL